MSGDQPAKRAGQRRIPAPSRSRDSARPLGELISALSDPFTQFRVHRPFDLATGSPAGTSTGLPTYLHRAHDQRLARLIDDVVPVTGTGASRLAVLVGGSSTGKTRACWEALHTLPPGWRVWRPGTVERLLAGLERHDLGQALTPRTVLWLDELQNYLLPGDDELGRRAALALHELLADPSRGPVLVLGTIWPIEEYWGALSAVPASDAHDPHQEARALVSGHGIRVQERIGSDLESARLIAESDPLWRLALSQAPDQPIQFIAGATALVERYESATPAGKAVLEAASDARRVGVPARLSLGFLRRAARDYLPEAAAGDWVRDAIENPVTGLRLAGRGVFGPLVPVTQSGAGVDDGAVYELADYVEQHLRRARACIQPRDSLWAAVADVVSDPVVLHAVAEAAHHRARIRPAALLYQRAAEAGHPTGWHEVALIRERAGDQVAAEQAAEYAAASGLIADVWTGRGRLWEEEGNLAAAALVYERAAAAGVPSARGALARVREKAGDLVGAEQAYEQQAILHVGPRVSAAWGELVRIRQTKGDLVGAEQAYQQAAAGGLQNWRELSRIREELGDLAGAMRLYEDAAAAGSADAWTEVARARLRAKDWVGFEAATKEQSALARRRQERDRGGWDELLRRLKAGDRAMRISLCEQFTAAGHPQVWSMLAQLLEQTGDRVGAEQAADRAASLGVAAGWTALVAIREKSADPVGVEQAAERAAAVGIPDVWFKLAQARESAADRAGAEHAYRRAAVGGHPKAWIDVARCRERAADPAGTEHAYEQAATSGNSSDSMGPGGGGASEAAIEAGHRVQRFLRSEDAMLNRQISGMANVTVATDSIKGSREFRYERAAAATRSLGWRGLARLREHAGDRDGAERLAQEAAAVGIPEVWTELAQIREKAADWVGAERLFGLAAASGHAYELTPGFLVASSVCVGLVRLREAAGDLDGANRIRRFGLTADGAPEQSL